MIRLEYISYVTLREGDQARTFLEPLREHLERRIAGKGYDPEWFYIDHTVETDYVGVRTLTMRAVPYGYARFELIPKSCE